MNKTTSNINTKPEDIINNQGNQNKKTYLIYSHSCLSTIEEIEQLKKDAIKELQNDGFHIYEDISDNDHVLKDDKCTKIEKWQLIHEFINMYDKTWLKDECINLNKSIKGPIIGFAIIPDYGMFSEYSTAKEMLPAKYFLPRNKENKEQTDMYTSPGRNNLNAILDNKGTFYTRVWYDCKDGNIYSQRGLKDCTSTTMVLREINEELTIANRSPEEEAVGCDAISILIGRCTSLENMSNYQAKQTLINTFTKPLGNQVAQIYGWPLSTQENKEEEFGT